MRDHVEVCPLSRGVILPLSAQPLSTPLQGSIRLLHLPLPASLWVSFTGRFPTRGRDTGLPCFASMPERGRLSLFAGSLDVHDRKLPTSCTSYVPILGQACQHLWLVHSHDVYRDFASA